jgi:glyoxylase-like metal-dependent hydrolase (beta-lactamase superfamily II)
MSEWRPLGLGVWTRQYPPFRMNVGLVLGDGACLLVDTRATEAEGEELRRDVTEVTTAPVVQVVNTHAHFDHCFGNAAFYAAEIWGHAECRHVLEEFGESERAYWAGRVEGINVEEFRRTTIVAPGSVLEDSATLTVGDRPVQLKFLGRGHTEHDIIVTVPDAEVVFAGDIVEEGSPPWFDDSWPMEWPDTVARFLDEMTEFCVPGHGRSMRRDDVEHQQRQLREVAKLSAAVVAGELDEAAAAVRSPFPEAFTKAAVQRTRETIDGEDKRGWGRG